MQVSNQDLLDNQVRSAKARLAALKEVVKQVEKISVEADLAEGKLCVPSPDQMRILMNAVFDLTSAVSQVQEKFWYGIGAQHSLPGSKL